MADTKMCHSYSPQERTQQQERNLPAAGHEFLQVCLAFKAKSLFFRLSPANNCVCGGRVRAWPFPQHRALGIDRAPDRPGCSGTPPCVHGLVEMRLDLTVVWELPWPGSALLFSFCEGYSPINLWFSQLHSPDTTILRILFPAVPLCPFPSARKHQPPPVPGSTQMDRTALSVLPTARMRNPWVFKELHCHYPHSC